LDGRLVIPWGQAGHFAGRRPSAVADGPKQPASLWPRTALLKRSDAIAQRGIDASIEEIVVAVRLQDCLQTTYDLLAEFSGGRSRAQPLAHERMDDMVQSDRHNHQAGTVENKAAVDVGPAVNLSTEKIAFLSSRAQSQPRQTAQLPQKQGCVNAPPGLLD